MLVGEDHGALGRALAAELAEVESRFAAELTSDLVCVNELARHLEQYRGKMLRPSLLLLAGWATAPDAELTDEHRTLAAVVEMVHMATLVHDDVLDEQEVRRQAATVNRLRGNETAVMLGDYLISHAYHLCSSLESQTPARLIARTTNTVCEGELLQLANRNNWSIDEQTYFQVIRRKTASLCGISCRLGALLAGGETEPARSFDAFGAELGTAFQIIDDVLDLTGDPQVVGKSLGKDLEKGKLTLPLIHLLETSPPAERQQLLQLLRGDEPDRFERIAASMHEGESLGYAKRRAEELVERAKQRLGDLPASPARDMLDRMADAVITRRF